MAGLVIDLVVVELIVSCSRFTGLEEVGRKRLLRSGIWRENTRVPGPGLSLHQIGRRSNITSTTLHDS